MSYDTGGRWRQRRRAITVIGIGTVTVAALAAPAFAHPSFNNVGPGFANPSGGTGVGTQTPPYSPGSRPTLNLNSAEHVDINTPFNGAPNTVVDEKILLPAAWTNPECVGAFTNVNNAPGAAVPGWTCAIENTPEGQVVHWSGPQVAGSGDLPNRAKYFSFKATMPSPVNQTSFGAFGGPLGVYLTEKHASGEVSDFKCPNDPRPLIGGPGSDVAGGLVRTVAGTSPPTPPPSGPPPTVSASDGKIVFQSGRDGNNEVYIMNADGSGQTRLTNNPASDTQPAISHDGNRVVFTSNRDGNNEIYIMNADGTGQARLTTFADADALASFSPDGSRIVFNRLVGPNAEFGNNDLFVMNADGTGQTNITNTTPAESAAMFSPDGSKIVYVFFEKGNRDIHIMNADGTGKTPLSPHPASDGGPSFTPDGRVGFHSNRTGNNEIYLVHANGSGLTQVTTNPADDQRPVFSPDGSKFAFSSDRTGNVEVSVAATNAGNGVLNLTNNPAADNFAGWAIAPDPIAACRPGAPTPAGYNVINGTPARDFLLGTPGNDIIHAHAGADFILAQAGDDIVCAGPGMDFVDGSDGADHISGSAGHDRLFGGNGDDRLWGGPGQDLLIGGNGTDAGIDSDPGTFRFQIESTS